MFNFNPKLTPKRFAKICSIAIVVGFGLLAYGEGHNAGDDEPGGTISEWFVELPELVQLFLLTASGMSFGAAWAHLAGWNRPLTKAQRAVLAANQSINQEAATK